MTLILFFQIYIIVNILLFSLPQFSDSYMRSGAYFLILPRALPFAQVLSAELYSRNRERYRCVDSRKGAKICTVFCHICSAIQQINLQINYTLFSVLTNETTRCDRLDVNFQCHCIAIYGALYLFNTVLLYHLEKQLQQFTFI